MLLAFVEQSILHTKQTNKQKQNKTKQKQKQKTNTLQTNKLEQSYSPVSSATSNFTSSAFFTASSFPLPVKEKTNETG